MKNPISVIAPTTGLVRNVSKAPGDPIDAEEAVIVMESMKMEIPVPAPVAGTVIEILVDKDDLVEEGQVVARLQPHA